jgi:hypothetical protein
MTEAKEGEGRSSFLKKRSKKLLSVWREASRSSNLPAKTNKSFLLLFFKKEDLPFAFSNRDCIAPRRTIGLI